MNPWHVGVPTVYFTLRHLRVDLARRLRAQACADERTIEETGNRALDAGLDALRPRPSP